MKTELQIFTDLAWQEKIDYLVGFYQGMIKKTNNSDYIQNFQKKIDEIHGYQDNGETNGKLITLYERIMGAKQKTKQRKIEETQKIIESHKEKLARIEANIEEKDPDEYLAQALAQC